MKRLLFLCVIMVFTVFARGNISEVEAASKYVRVSTYDGDKKINGTTFGVRQQEDDYYSFDIVMIKNGISQTIIEDVSEVFFTNGKIIYFQVYTSGKTNIYQYSVKTGKKQKIVSGKGYNSIIGCKGKYLYYCGQYIPAEETSKMYVINVKTKKRKYITKYASYIHFTKNKAITGDESGQAYNGPIYSFKFDGSAKKKIAEGCGVKTKGNTVYYKKVSDSGLFKVYSCTSEGKNHKALTGWCTYKKIPKKYK